MPAKITVVEEAPPNTSESSQSPQNEHGSENAQRQAEAYGALQAEYKHAQDRIGQLESRLMILEAERVDTAALRSELAQLRSEVIELEEELEPDSNVTEVIPEPEPEPIIVEEPPVIPREPWFKIMLRI